MNLYKFFKALIPIGLAISIIGYFGMEKYNDIRPREYVKMYSGDLNSIEKFVASKEKLRAMVAGDNVIIEENYKYYAMTEGTIPFDWRDDLTSYIATFISNIFASSCQKQPSQPPPPVPTPTPGPGLPGEPPIPPGSGTQAPDWGWLIMKVQESHKVTKGKGIKVCVLDTGIDLNHPDAGKIIAGMNFTSYNTQDIQDRMGHGSHTSGIIAAKDNNFGTVGASPEVDLLIGKVLGDDGSGSLEGISRGLQWCADQGAHIINMSLGSPQPAQIMYQATQYARSRGSILIASAGNSGNTVPNYPASYDTVISVSATMADERLANFSSFGSNVRYAAPGKDINSTCMGSRYCLMSGTSMSAPYASGVCALALAAGKSNCNGLGVYLAPGIYQPVTHGMGRVNSELSTR